jgi:hypothetical protein
VSGVVVVVMVVVVVVVGSASGGNVEEGPLFRRKETSARVLASCRAGERRVVRLRSK